MVKFAKRFFYQVIPEWKDQYIDYRALYRQIKAVKASVLDLAKAYAHIKGTSLLSI
jgi:SPX domain protein involved in polyphosphate accumulation